MPIDNFSIEWLTDDAQAAVRAEAKTFCLRMIKNVYGIDYTPAWHSDLDSLLLAQPDNWFPSKGKAVFSLCGTEMDISLRLAVFTRSKTNLPRRSAYEMATATATATAKRYVRLSACT